MLRAYPLPGAVTLRLPADKERQTSPRRSSSCYVDDSSPMDGQSEVNGFAGVFPEGSDLGALSYSYTIR